MKNLIISKIGISVLIAVLMMSFQNLKAQSSLPDYEGMLQQGVPYDVIKTQTEAIINTSSTTGMNEGSEFNHYKRWINYWNPRAYVNGGSVASPLAYKQAMFDYHTFNSCGNSSTPEWTFLGPFRINKTGTTVPVSVMGRVEAVAMHSSNLDIMYIGTPSSGVWKSTNAQNSDPTWVNITDGYGFDNIGVTDIVIDPSNPNKIYASTGRVSNGFGIGVLVSTTGGSSWEQTTLQYLQANEYSLDYVKQ